MLCYHAQTNAAKNLVEPIPFLKHRSTIFTTLGGRRINLLPCPITSHSDLPLRQQHSQPLHCQTVCSQELLTLIIHYGTYSLPVPQHPHPPTHASPTHPPPHHRDTSLTPPSPPPPPPTPRHSLLALMDVFDVDRQPEVWYLPLLCGQ